MNWNNEFKLMLINLIFYLIQWFGRLAVDARNLRHIRQIRPWVGNCVVSILQNEANVLPQVINMRDRWAKVLPEDTLQEDVDHQTVHHLGQHVPSGVQHPVTESHGICEGSREERGDGVRSGRTGVGDGSRVEADGVDVDEGDLEVVDHTQSAFWVGPVEDEKVVLLPGMDKFFGFVVFEKSVTHLEDKEKRSIFK